MNDNDLCIIVSIDIFINAYYNELSVSVCDVFVEFLFFVCNKPDYNKL